MSVVLSKVMLLALLIVSLIYLAILKPCAGAIVSFGTLIGMVRFTAKGKTGQWTVGGPLRDVNI
jgi:hypothetical protein